MSATPSLWLITGGSGFLGANIGHFLGGSAERLAVTRTGTVPSGFDSALPGDLAHPEVLAAHIRDVRPAVVVHAAALASHEACEQDPSHARRINAEATGILARAAAAADARFVFVSTDAVFDGERGHYTEEDTPSPASVYGRTKLLGEQRATAEADALILRTNFFGWSPSGARSILEFFVNELGKGRMVRGFTDFTTTSAYAQVLAESIAELVAKQKTGIFHLTSPDALTKYGFGVAVAEEFGLDPSLITPTLADIYPPRNGDISLDVSKVMGVLDTPLPSQREGIARAHADSRTLRHLLRQTSTP